MTEQQPTSDGTPAAPPVPPEAATDTHTAPSTPVIPAEGDREHRREPGHDPLRGSRTSGIWAGTVVAAVLLVLLIVFIVQNTQAVQVSYFGWTGTAPLSAALLVAATAGLLLAIIAGSLRILQLRRRVRRGSR